MQPSQTQGRIVFACGATFEGVREFPEVSHEKADGRVRLAVFDSEDLDEKHCGRPRIGVSPESPKAGGVAPCRFGCPAKRASGRKEQRCFPSDELAASKYREEHGVLPWRTVITCYGRVEGLRKEQGSEKQRTSGLRQEAGR